MAPRKPRRQVKVNALTQAQLIKLLLEGTYNCRALAEMTGLHYITVLQYTRALYAAGAAHISSWDQDSRGRESIRVYKLGPGQDAKRNVRTPAEVKAAYRGRQRAKLISDVLAGAVTLSASNNGGLKAERVTLTA